MGTLELIILVVVLLLLFGYHHWSTAAMKIKTLVASAATLAVTLSAGAARATDDPPPQPVSSTLIARGTASELHVRDHSICLTLTARQPTDVALVKATIIPGGQTGWHMHPGPSIVIVQAGTSDHACTSPPPLHGRAVRRR